MQHALAIAQFKWPKHEIVFVFNNSSCHDSFAKDALNVNKMNVKLGGAQAKMHDTVIPKDNPLPELQGTPQRMVFPADHPDPKLRGQAKGMRVVLQERGLIDSHGKNRAGKKIPGQCKSCKAKRARKPHLSGPTNEEIDADLGKESDDGDDGDDDGEDCCLQRMLSRQSDFRDEPCELQKVRSKTPAWPNINPSAGHRGSGRNLPIPAQISS